MTPGTGVVILSRDAHEWYVTEALRRGALGYVGKHSDAGPRRLRTSAEISGLRDGLPRH
jgi:DNA-binding NarL/FixJ family response regulator